MARRERKTEEKIGHTEKYRFHPIDQLHCLENYTFEEFISSDLYKKNTKKCIHNDWSVNIIKVINDTAQQNNEK